MTLKKPSSKEAPQDMYTIKREWTQEIGEGAVDRFTDVYKQASAQYCILWAGSEQNQNVVDHKL